MYRIGIQCKIASPRLRYTLSFLDQHPLCRRAEVSFSVNPPAGNKDFTIRYGFPEYIPAALIMPAQDSLFNPDVSPTSFFLNRYSFDNTTVYGVETEKSENTKPAFSDYRFQFDLLEAIFFHISRYEEVIATAEELDEAGWLKEEAHLLIRNGLQKRAVVDDLVAALLKAILGRSRAPSTTYDLTHDLDFLYRYPSPWSFARAMAGSLFRTDPLPNMRRHWNQYFRSLLGKGKDPYNCFHWLFAPTSGWRQKTLFLMAGGETRYDNHYRIDDPQVADLIDQARGQGYSIGFHPSYNAGFKPDLFNAEKARLEAVTGEKIIRSRQHWLRWDWSVTPYLLEANGIREDASFGYRRHLGFRAGTGFPYHPYDFRTEAAFPWKERPLVVMDSSAIHEAHRTGRELTGLMIDFLQQNAARTHISINFHNSNFAPTLAYGQELSDFYKNVILPLGE